MHTFISHTWLTLSDVNIGLPLDFVLRAALWHAVIAPAWLELPPSPAVACASQVEDFLEAPFNHSYLHTWYITQLIKLNVLVKYSGIYYSPVRNYGVLNASYGFIMNTFITLFCCGSGVYNLNILCIDLQGGDLPDDFIGLKEGTSFCSIYSLFRWWEYGKNYSHAV